MCSTLSRIAATLLITTTLTLIPFHGCLAEASEPAMVPQGKYCGTYELFGFVHLLIEVRLLCVLEVSHRTFF